MCRISHTKYCIAFLGQWSPCSAHWGRGRGGKTDGNDATQNVGWYKRVELHTQVAEASVDAVRTVGVDSESGTKHTG